MASKNPFAKTIGPPGSKKSGFLGQGIVNSSVTGTNNPKTSKGNMSDGGSMQAQIDAIKRRLDTDVADDAKADKPKPAGKGKNKAITSPHDSEGGNITSDQRSNGIG